MRFTISRNHLQALLLCAAKSDIRHYLNGVMFRRFGDTLVAVATDGHRMLVVKTVDTDGGERWADSDGEYIIARECLEIAAKWKESRYCAPLQVLIEDGDGNAKHAVTIAHLDGMSVRGETIDGKFPDFERVIPRPLPGEYCDGAISADLDAPATYNAEYIADFAKVAKLVNTTAKHSPPWNIETRGGDSAAIVRFGNAHAWGILMPMRYDAPAEIPESFQAPAVEAQHRADVEAKAAAVAAELRASNPAFATAA